MMICDVTLLSMQYVALRRKVSATSVCTYQLPYALCRVKQPIKFPQHRDSCISARSITKVLQVLPDQLLCKR